MAVFWPCILHGDTNKKSVSSISSFILHSIVLLSILGFVVDSSLKGASKSNLAYKINTAANAKNAVIIKNTSL